MAGRYTKMIECCMCSNDAEAVGKSRCRKIHEPSCEVEKLYLENLAVNCRGVRLNCFIEIGQRKDATICYHCLQKLKKCTKMEKELEGLKQELIKLLNNLSVEGNDVIASTAKRKVSDSTQGRSNKVLRRKQPSIHHEQQLHTEAEDFPSESDDLDEAGEGPSEAYAHASPDVLVSFYLVA